MVKIEQIKPGTVATVMRDDQRQQVFQGQLITRAEADTLEVTGGEIVYSIDEAEVVTKSSNPAPAVSQTTEEPKLSAKERIEALKASLNEPTE